MTTIETITVCINFLKKPVISDNPGIADNCDQLALQ